MQCKPGFKKNNQKIKIFKHFILVEDTPISETKRLVSVKTSLQ
jgi:hypothetical protein